MTIKSLLLATQTSGVNVDIGRDVERGVRARYTLTDFGETLEAMS